VIVIKASSDDIDIRCGGVAMLRAADASERTEDLKPGFSQPSLLGKRYSWRPLGLEVLVTQAGDGTLAVGEQVMDMESPRELPSSD
jgi:hypothetical protein